MAEIAKGIIDIEINTGGAASQLQALQTQINAFNLALNKSNKAQGTFASEYSRELQSAINKTGLFTAETIRLQTAAATLDKTLSKGKTSLGQFFSAKFNKNSAVAAETMALAAERAKRLQTQFIATSGAANGFQDALAVRPLAAFSSQAVVAAQKTQILSNMFKQGTTQLINFGKNVQWAGRQLMVGFTVPLTIFGAIAGKTFMDLEKQAVAFKKVYGDIFTTPAELNKNLEAVKGLAAEYTKYGVAVKDTIGLAAQAAAAGRQDAELTDAVTQATRLATLGQMDQNAALETTISLQSAFRLSGKELGDTINFLNMVENQTVVSLQDIATAIPRVAPVIQGLGGDVKDLTVFLAAMQEGGVDAAEGANALKSGLASLINPTKQANEMLSGMGINLDSIIQANRGDLMGTVRSFAEALQGLDQFSRQQALEQVFGKFQYAKLGALFENISREGSQAQQVIATMGYSTEQLGATADKELKTIEESFGVQLTGAVERFKLAIAPIGEIFVKLAIPLVNFATKIVEGFNGLSDTQKRFTAIAAVIVGVVIPAVTMMAGLFLNLVGTLAKIGQGMALFGKGFLTGGPVGAVKALTQSSKYLSLAEMDAAMAAQQLSGASQVLNTTLIKQVGTANAAATAIANLTRAYSAMAATQAAASGFPSFGVAGAAGAAAKEGKTSAVRVRGLRRNSGGGVPGSGNTDTVPAMLTPGEFVVNKEATKENLGLLKSINDGQKLNSGGKVSSVQYLNEGDLVRGLRNIPGGFGDIFDNLQIDPSLFVNPSQMQQTINPRPAARMTTPQFSSLVLGSSSLDDMIKRLGLSIFGIPDKMNTAMASNGKGVKVSELLQFLKDGGPDVVETLNDALEQSGSTERIDTKKLHAQVVKKLQDIENMDPGRLIKDSPSSKKGMSFLGLDEIVDGVIDKKDKDLLESLRSNSKASGRLVAKSGPAKLESDARVSSVVKDYLVKNGVISPEEKLSSVRVPGRGKNSKPTIEIHDSRGNVMARYQYGATLTDATKGLSYNKLNVSKTFEKILSNLLSSKSKFAGSKIARAHFADGGPVPGSGNTDTVPAMLTPGEFVVNKKAASQNQGILEMMNGGQVKGYALGGVVQGAGGVAAMGGMMSGNMPVMVAGTVLQMLGPAIGRLQGSLKEGAKLGPAFKNMLPVVSRFAFGMTSMAGGLALAGFAIYKLNKQISDAEKSGAEFTNAMYGSAKTIEGIAKQFGNQTNAQKARIAAVERAGGQEIGQEAQAKSAEFVQSDAGKQMLKDVATVKAGGGNAVEALRNQLSSAIVAGAIGTEEARAIAAEVGTALGDQSIAVGVSGELTKLMGPNGEDMLKNLSSITAEISPKINVTKLASDATSAYEKINVGAKFIQAFQGGEAEFIKNFKINEVSATNSAAFAKEAEARELLNLAYQQGTISLEEYLKQSSAIAKSSKENQNTAAQGLGFSDQTALATAAEGKLVTTGRGGMAVARTEEQKIAADAIKGQRTEIENQLKEIPEMQGEALDSMMANVDKLGGGLFGELLNGTISFDEIPLTIRLQEDGMSEEDIIALHQNLNILQTIPNIDMVIDIDDPDPAKIQALVEEYKAFEKLSDTEKKAYVKTNVSSEELNRFKTSYEEIMKLPDNEIVNVTTMITREINFRTQMSAAAIGGDREQKRLLQAEADNAEKYVKSLLDSIKTPGSDGTGATDGSGGSGGKEEDLLKMLMERFRLQEMLIDKQAEGFNERVKQLNREIELEERQVNLRQKGLDDLSKKEEAVNKAYDLRVEALDKVSESNSRVNEQEKSRISLASALASGDIAAAASITSDMQQQSTQYQIEDARAALEKQRQVDLDSLTVSINGKLMTRQGIESEIEAIQDRIYNKGIQLRGVQDTLIGFEQRKLDVAKEREKVETRMYLMEQRKAIEALKGKTNLSKADKAALAEYESSFNNVRGVYNAANPGAKVDPLKSVATKPATGASSPSAKPKPTFTTPAAPTLPKVIPPKPGPVRDVHDKPKTTPRGGPGARMANGGIAYRGSTEAPPAIRMHDGFTVPGTGMTDKVNALLTPGEFVVRKSVADENRGFLNQLNSQVFPAVGQGISSPKYSMPGQSVTNIPVNNANVVSNSSPMYNSTYNVNVNVSGTNASPDDIANVVMSKLSQQNRGNLRSNRY